MAKDLFSKQSSSYAAFRPGYPSDLVNHILAHTQHRDAMWDCATGNGQAAILFAPHFQKIYATDLSENQLSHAFKAENINYQVGAAEDSGLPSHSVNLITVAQAFHWFNQDAFYREVLRVAVPGATIAVWGYGLFQTNDPLFNTQIWHLYHDILGEYWDKERAHIEDRYAILPFPYKTLPSMDMTMEYQWDESTLKGYLDSWSSVQHFKARNGADPIAPWMRAVSSYIRHPFKVHFPLFAKLGQVIAS